MTGRFNKCLNNCFLGAREVAGFMTSSQLAIAYLADLVFGDPAWMPHPVRFFGFGIAGAEKVARRFARSPRALRLAGLLMTASISAGVGMGTWLLLKSVGKFSLAAAFVATIYLAYSTLSVRGLDQAGKQVIEHLKSRDVEKARAALAMIVGRDTDKLDEPEIVRAVIETVAENTSDGIVAPMFYLGLGGVPAALAYKAINTLDSMVGYKNDRYLYFGWAAARLDDIVNFVPSRLTALLVAVAALILRLAWKNSLWIVARDARLQPSPNSGFSEAAYAGALGIQLGGLNFYEGRPTQKAYLGDLGRKLIADLYPEVRGLLYVTSALMLVLSVGIAAVVRTLVWP